MTGHRAAGIGEELEFPECLRDFDARALIDPFGNFLEGVAEELLLDLRRLGDGEVEVFGKAIGFEVTFLETRSSFEYPVLGESGMPIDAREYLAEHVVLFDDLRPQPEGSSCIQDLTSLDHTDVPVAQLSGTRRRHREMMRRH